jgi:integrase
MKAQVNVPRYRRGWTTKQGKKKQGFWYVYDSGKKINLTSRYGAPTTNKTKRDKTAALDARARFIEDLRQTTTHDTLIGRSRVVTVRQVIELYRKEVWPDSSEGWRDTSGWFFRLFCDGHNGEVYRNNPRKIEPYAGWGDKAAESITHDDIRDWFGHHEWAKSGSRNAIMSIKAAFNHALNRKRITANPIADFKTTRNHAEIAWFTGQEEEEYQKAAEKKSPAFALFWRACLSTGARPSELAKAKACHVRVTNNGRFYIRLTEWKNAKKKKQPRIIHLPNGWQDWIAQRLEECSPDDFLFVTERQQTSWKKCNWINNNLAVLKASGIEKKLTLYSCRHTRATRLLLAGATAKQVADWLGTSTTQIDSTYGHLLEHTEAMGDLLDSFC